MQLDVCDGPPNACGKCSVCVEVGVTADTAPLQKLQELSEEFDVLCQQRHEMGEKKYGAGTWLGVDNLEMCIEELIDMANYLRFAFIKLRMLQEGLGTDRSTEKPLPGNEMLGKNAFVSAVRRPE